MFYDRIHGMFKVDVSVEKGFSDYLTYKTYAQGLSIHLHKNGECGDMARLLNY